MSPTDWVHFTAIFGAKLKKARKVHNLTQKAASERIGITLRHLQDIEAGKVDLKISTLQKIVSSLELREPSLEIDTRHDFFEHIRPSIKDDVVFVFNRIGEIVSTNAAWKAFAKDNDFSLKHSKLNYFEVCQKAADSGCLTAEQVLIALSKLKQDSIEEFTINYSCHAPLEKRWYYQKIYKLHNDLFVCVNVLERVEPTNTAP